MRWSFIVAFPTHKLIVEKEKLFVNGVESREALGEVIRAHLRNDETLDHVVVPFLSGLVGYVGYEVGGLFEPSLSLPSSPYALPDMALGRYEAVCVFDRENHQAYIYGKTHADVELLFDALDSDIQVDCEETKSSSNFVSSNFSKSDYIDAVSGVREAILNGDFFQTNLSRCISVTLDEMNTLYSFYKEMMIMSDAGYAAFLQFDRGNLLSNSPEKFFTLEVLDNVTRLSVEPIKGTIARDENPSIDVLLQEQLKTSVKDRAENIMIADLLRNDISRVCTNDSVYEDDICALMSLRHVHHLVSRISGILRPGNDVVDVLSALFPCGSITGAPKIEAMKAIARMEKSGRGPYCGAVGFIDDRGNADFSVAIRTLIQETQAPETFHIPVGGGVTLQSDPEAEYEETSLKAKGYMNLLQIPLDDEI